MALMQGRQQAQLAFSQVQGLPKHDIEPYAQIIAKVTPMIMSCGLVQTLAFLAAKAETKHRLVLRHLAAHLARHASLGVSPTCQGVELVDVAASASRSTYRLLSRLALGAVGWLKRFSSAREIELEAGKGTSTVCPEGKEVSA